MFRRARKFDKKKVIDSALGKIDFDLVIKNCQLVNVITGEIYPAEVGITDGQIAHVKADPDNLNRERESLKGIEEYDAKGNYLIPGLIDAHMHIESSMLSPRKFGEIIIPFGTTTLIADPHEIGNVYGAEGVRYMYDNSQDIPMRQIYLVPSCVPAVENMENTGADLGISDTEKLLKLERVIGIGEVMDYVGVLDYNERMGGLLDYAEDRGIFIQGHAPMLSGRKLSAYLVGGPNTDHETVTSQEAKDKIRNGMFVDSREGSIAKNIDKIWQGVKGFKYFDFLTLCTDDREVDEVLESGHMNDVVRCAVRYGMDPIDAIKSATLNVAREVGYRDLGAIAPGFVADLVIMDNLKDFNPQAVFFEGRLTAENGKLLEKIEDKRFDMEEKNSMNLEEISLEDLEFRVDKGMEEVSTNVIAYQGKISLMTDLSVEKLPVKDGKLDISGDRDLKYVAVINRYGKGTMGKAVVRDFGTEHGAVASTVAHDCHNLVVIYDKPENALLAIEELKRAHGGITTVVDGEVRDTIELPVAGIMTNISGHELSEKSEKVKETLKEMGLKEINNPLLRIATIALPVIPNIKISDMGIIDVNKQEFIKPFNI